MKTLKYFHCFMVLGLLFAARPVFSQTPTLGVQLYAGVSISGTNAGLYAVQATTNLTNSNGWACVGLVQLPATNYFWADTSKNASSGQRFYRVVSAATNLIYILPGTFTMGSPTNEALRGADETQHVVTLTKGFYMGKFPVTQGEYQGVTGSNPSTHTGNINYPVETLTWIDATNYCGLRTVQERAAGLIPTNWVYRLPTESEWEYAARAGTVTAFFLGSILHSQQANFAGTNEYDAAIGTINNPSGVAQGTTTPVGNYGANGWGLYDMEGNVMEFCSDWSGAYPVGNVTDPQGVVTGTLTQKVRRGGAYASTGAVCRSAFRGGLTPLGHGPLNGFRVVLAQP